jgi:hypothetical protein
MNVSAGIGPEMSDPALVASVARIRWYFSPGVTRFHGFHETRTARVAAGAKVIPALCGTVLVASVHCAPAFDAATAQAATKAAEVQARRARVIGLLRGVRTAMVHKELWCARILAQG